jgi:hypothetical protein
LGSAGRCETTTAKINGRRGLIKGTLVVEAAKIGK